MNILIYIPDITQSWGGIRQYAAGLIRLLSKDAINKYYIYHNSNDPEILDLLKNNVSLYHVQDADISLSKITKRIKIDKYIRRVIIHKAWRTIKIKTPSLIELLIKSFRIDIVHCPYQFIPKTNKAKLIVTLHDVQELHFPDFFSAEERASRAVNFLDYLRRADKVVVSYEHVKQDLITYFAVDATAINVILLDMGKLWFDRFTLSDVSLLQQLNLPDDFILFPANTWKHKNHVRLLQAIALLRDKYDCKVNLICSGHLTPYFSEIQSVADELKLTEQVKFLGVVDEVTLYNLYKRCRGVVVPTLYEAGSFPLMESILMQVPVVCSNVTSLPETVDNKKFVFDPFSVESIALAVRELYSSESYQQESIANSRIVGQKLLSTGALQKCLAMYAEAMSARMSPY